MSICRSEALFSSMRDSATAAKDGNAAAAAEQPPDKRAAAPDAPQDGAAAAASAANASSLISDSLIDGACSIDFTEQVKVNKNHYQLTYSRHGGVNMGASMEASAHGLVQQQQLPTVIGKHTALGYKNNPIQPSSHYLCMPFPRTKSYFASSSSSPIHFSPLRRKRNGR